MRMQTLLFAAAIAIGTASTQAEAKSTMLLFNGTCDIARLTPQAGQKGLWAYFESQAKTDSCDNVTSAGLEGKTTIDGENGQWIFIAVPNPAHATQATTIAVKLPLKTGNPYVAFGSSDGKHAAVLTSGTYNVVSAAEVAPKNAPDLFHARQH